MSEQKDPIYKSTLLVIEDEMTTRLIIEKSLKDYKLLVADCGEQALLLWEKYRSEIEVVLLDRMLPDMKGDQICTKIRADGMGKDVAIIFLTAQDSPEDVKSGLELGANDYIRKPIKPVELVARVTTQLEAKRGKELEMHVKNLQIVHNLVARLNHELRNSMTVINGVVMTWNAKSEDEQDKVKMIREALKHMTEVLDKVSSIEELKLTTYTKTSTMLDI